MRGLAEGSCAYGAAQRVTLEPTVTPAVQTRAGSYSRSREVAITAALKAESHMGVSTVRAPNYTQTHPNASGFPAVWNGELDGSCGWRFPPAFAQHTRGVQYP